jgi:hypothetical protein
MYTSVECNLCETIIMTLDLKEPVDSLMQLPNTFSGKDGAYAWKFHEIMGYALLPRSTSGRIAVVDLYLCIEEDDLDDIDVLGYVTRYIREHLLPKWANVKDFRLTQPVLATAQNLKCRRRVQREREMPT